MALFLGLACLSVSPVRGQLLWSSDPPQLTPPSSATVQVVLRNDVARVTSRTAFGLPAVAGQAAHIVVCLPQGGKGTILSSAVDDAPIEVNALAPDDAFDLCRKMLQSTGNAGALALLQTPIALVVVPARSGDSRCTFSVELTVPAETRGQARFLSLPLDRPWWLTGRPCPAEFSVDLETDKPLGVVWSPSHLPTVLRSSARSALVSLPLDSPRFGADFELLYTQAGSETDVAAYGAGEMVGADKSPFSLLVSTPFTAGKMAGVDLFLAVDVSASMKGAPLACEKQIAGLLLDSLADDGRFNVATFAAGVARRFESWAPADAKSKSQAREFLAEAAAGEPTNLGDGLVAAFRDTSEDRPCFVVLLSDGCSNLGSPAKEMASLAAVAKKRPVRFLAVAMGQNANMGLLGQIAGLVGGVSIRVIDPGNPASAGAAAAAVIASAGPLATEGLRVRHPGIGVTEWLAPVRESALPGTPIEFMGIAANLEKLAFDVSFQPPGTRGELRLTCGIEKIGRSVGDLRRRYGYLRARQLVADPGVHNDVPAAVEALCDAALRYHLVTSYSYPMFLPLSVPVTDGVLGEMRLQKRLADRADLGWQERDAAVRWARQAGLLYLGEGMRTTSSLLDEARVVPPLASTKAELEVAKPGIDAEAKGDDEKDDLLPKTEARTVGGDLAGHLQQVAIEKQRGRFSQAVVKSAAGRMFYRVQDEWVDGALDPKAEIAAVRFASDLYFALFRRSDLCREVFPCGQKLVFMLKAGTALRVGPQGLTTLPPDELKGLLP